MKSQSYKEFKVVFDNKGNVIDKVQTKRGTVRINTRTAQINNAYSKSTHLTYELVEEENSNRAALEAEAKELGIEFRANIGDAKLAEKIEAAKTE